MIDIDVQLVSRNEKLPSISQFKHWATTTLERFGNNVEIVIRIVDQQEGALLNQTYRNREGPTNVLSFPFDNPMDIPLPLLGDLVICAAVVEREAEQQNKSFEAHCAHMVIHGVLHLHGFDHITADEAREMESEEINILKNLGFSNPYVVVELI